MLQRFETINFKSFKDHLILDLNASNYAYNKSSVQDGVMSTALVYGENASGKSNIGLAIFDIINSTTNKESNKIYHSNYSCLMNDFDDVYFKYHFKFKKNTVVYEYIKSDYQTLLFEKLTINNKTVLKLYRDDAYKRKWEHSKYSQIQNIGEYKKYSKANILESQLPGTETLEKHIRNPNLSVISYIKTNANLDFRKTLNKSFRDFVYFLDHMLWFRSVESNTYLGLITGNGDLDSELSKENKVKKLQEFLNDCGIDCRLANENNKVVQIFPDNKSAYFYDIASSGTKALALLFFWTLTLNENEGKFLFIDEFDSTFHTLLAKKIINKLKESNIQVLLTSHNTNLMSNEVLRPDAYFILQDGKIKSMNNLTNKELREVHNLEKLYLANTFTHE